MLAGVAVWLLLLICVPLQADEGGGRVIGTKNGKVYHIYPDECASARRIQSDRRVVFDTEEAAKRAGRRLCRRCEQLRHKHQEAEQAEPAPPTGRREKSDRSGRGGENPARPRHRSTDAEPPESPAPIYAVVTQVLAGGTIELDIGEKVCPAGVVCPQEGQPLAEDAVRFIIEQTRGRKVRLTLPVPLESQGSRDVFGCLRAYITPGEDGRDLGGELVFQGYAWVCRDRNCGRHAEYTRREEEAWRAQRGIWKPIEGAAGRREVVTGRHARHYFVPDSPNVARLSGLFKLTLNEAKSRRLPPYPERHAVAGKMERTTHTDASTKEKAKHETLETADAAT